MFRPAFFSIQHYFLCLSPSIFFFLCESESALFHVALCPICRFPFDILSIDIFLLSPVFTSTCCQWISIHAHGFTNYCPMYPWIHSPAASLPPVTHIPPLPWNYVSLTHLLHDPLAQVSTDLMAHCLIFIFHLPYFPASCPPASHNDYLPAALPHYKTLLHCPTSSLPPRFLTAPLTHCHC